MDERPGQRLTRTGYYLLPELSPDEAEALSFRRREDKHHADDLDCAYNSLPHATGATRVVPGVGTNDSSVLKSLAFFSLPVHAGAP